MFSADQLLHPIRPGQPCGDDLSFSPDLDAIGQARKFDDPSLDQGEWVTDLKEADWDFVERSCVSLLSTRSKDLRLAVWLAEAAAKRHGMRGLLFVTNQRLRIEDQQVRVLAHDVHACQGW